MLSDPGASARLQRLLSESPAAHNRVKGHPHIDRSLRSYCKTIDPTNWVSVLYITVPDDRKGGELVLRSRQRLVGRIQPEPSLLLWFQGDLTHSVNAVVRGGDRLSLVCEQYRLEAAQLEKIPPFLIESRALTGKGDHPISHRSLGHHPR